MTDIQTLLRLLRQELTFNKSWIVNLSWMMAFGYFLILQGDPGTEVALRSSLLMLVSLVGMLGISSLQKGNVNGELRVFTSKLRGILIVLFYTILLIIPWFYLPLDRINGSLLIVQLGTILSVLIVNSKATRKNVFSSVLLIFYSRIIPLAIVLWTFYLIGNQSYKEIYLLGGLSMLWQLIVGIRKEIKEDSRALKLSLLVAELTVFLCLSWLLSSKLSYSLIILGIAVLGIGTVILLEKTPKKLIPIASKAFDTFYSDWLAYFFLVSIIFIETEVTILFLVHLILLQNGLRSLLFKFLQVLMNSRRLTRLFDFPNYRRGLMIHLALLLGYTLLFCIAYKIIEAYILDDQAFFRTQQILSKFLVLTILFHGFLLVFLNRKMVTQTARSFLLETGSPHNLAIFRIVFFVIIIGSFYGEVFQEFEHWTHLPDSERAALPFIGWLIEILPISPGFYKVMSFIGLGLAITILFGFKTRWALIFYVPIALYLWGVPNFFGKLNHRHIMVWVPIILVFSRCADVLSIDAIIARYRKRVPDLRESVEYALPFKMIWITLGIIYCSSGFHKLWDTGLFWALSDNLKNQIQLEWIEQYDTIKSFRIDQFPTLLNIGGVGIILMEIIYPVLILKAYTRIFAFLGAWFLHLSAGYFLFIDFFHLRIANLSLIDWTKWTGRIRKKLPEKVTSVPAREPFKLSELKKMPIVYVGGGLIAMNLLFSILEINSWPFSGYPSYSSVVADKVTLVEMDARDANGIQVDVKAIGKNAHFRWESIRPFEERIAELAAMDDTTGLQNKLNSYWNLWATKVDSLESITTVRMNLVTTHLAPEKRGIVLDSIYLGKVHVKD